MPSVEAQVQLPRHVKQRTSIGKKTKNSLTTASRILLVLHYLKSGKSYRQVCPKPLVKNRNLTHLRLASGCSDLQRFNRLCKERGDSCVAKTGRGFKFHRLASSMGTLASHRHRAIDCTTHTKGTECIQDLEVSIGGDHKSHALTVQLITGLSGVVYSVVVMLGHNNDKGVFNATGVEDFLFHHKVKLAADLGYNSPFLITPDSANPLNHIQLQLRSVVETCFSFAKSFGFARNKCTTNSPALDQWRKKME